MSILNSFLTAGLIGWRIIYPIFREISAILLAVAIVKDSKARSIKRRFLWGLFTLAAPLFAGITYFVYSRFGSSHKPENVNDMALSIHAKLLVLFSAVSYAISLVVLAASVITTLTSGIIGVGNGEFIPKYYDRNGVEYCSPYDVPLYDEAGNEYFRTAKHLIIYGFIDENGKEYFDSNVYISEDGYIFIDENNILNENKTNEIYYDGNGKKYKLIYSEIFWDSEGLMRFNNRYKTVVFD